MLDEKTLSVLRLAELIQDVLPPGVFNLITGSGSKSGDYMLKHQGFSKLAFTGSTEIGCAVADAAASKLIPATLELGGKSANIYFDDCNMDLAMDGLQLGILFNQGQVCCAGSRVFVQEKIYDEFVKRAVEAFKKVKVGDPLDPATLADVTNNMRVAQEEIFGPVAVIIKFKTEDEVVKMANDSVYGLGGAVWTRDLNRAIRVSRAIETGRMWVNTYNSIPAGAPFGGYKKSGIGRETHKIILEHYTQMKNIMINLNEAPSGFYPG
jgi:acyl-CoA reductase-like NAD-dependent aldehyde dehydrogenase